MKDYSTRTTRNDAGSRMDWVRTGILAGFIATFAMTVTLTAAWLLANALGDPNGGQLARWMDNLAHNRIEERVGDAFVVGMVLNVVIGIAWALIYARFFEPAFAMPGITEGLLFSLIPFALSVAVVFPLMDAGFLGSELGAGPLPFIGNLVLHLVYGATLGFVYGIEEEHGIPDNAGDRRANATAELGAAIGVVGGGVIGAIVGWIAAPGLDGLADRPVMTLAGILIGAAAGASAGSFLAMKADEDDDATSGHLPRRRHA